MHLELWHDIGKGVWRISVRRESNNEIAHFLSFNNHDDAFLIADMVASFLNLPLYEVDNYGNKTVME